MSLRDIGCEVDRTDSGSCSVAAFGIGDVEPFSSNTGGKLGYKL
jgi:hypothetical protein